MFEILALAFIFVVVLTVPFCIRSVEHNLEFFLLIMGLIAATVTWSWDRHLLEEMLVTPLPISGAVLVAGSIVHLARRHLAKGVSWISDRISTRILVFLTVVILGLVSSVISAIIAALFLTTVLNLIPIDRKSRINVAIVACFAIGSGAVLTPLGEPLSTIAISKLQGAPYHADFFFLADLLWVFVVPLVLLMGLFAVTPLVLSSTAGVGGPRMISEESYKGIIFWVFKVFVFVVALVLLGESFRILIDKYFIKLAPEGLFWLNTVSAVLDNATLAAAEVGPSLSIIQIKAVLISLMVSGGMLIPGNIPNIIAAGRLGIGMRDWARLAIPMGVTLLAVYFVILFYVL